MKALSIAMILAVVSTPALARNADHHKHVRHHHSHRHVVVARDAAPGQGAYARLADVLRGDHIASLRLCYRHPNVLPECALDILAGIAYLQQGRVQRVVLVGHSFGGAVVITAGAVHDRVAGVVALASQTYGARLAGQLAPRPLLVVHGKADTRLPYTCGVQIYDWAQEPKQLVLYEGAEHRLDECAEDLDQLLTQWIPATLRASVSP